MSVPIKRKALRIATAFIIVATVGFLLSKVPHWMSPPIGSVRFAPGGSDKEAELLVRRMLRVNRAWLHPRPHPLIYTNRVTTTLFSLWRGRVKRSFLIGPFSLDFPPNGAELLPFGGEPSEDIYDRVVKSHYQTPLLETLLVDPPHIVSFLSDTMVAMDSRVRLIAAAGALSITPLCAMAFPPGTYDYSVHMVGTAQWRGRSLVCVEVHFDPNYLGAPCAMNLGGVELSPDPMSGPFSGNIREVRIVIDVAQAIPLYIKMPVPEFCSPCYKETPSWTFSPDFYTVGNQRLPRTITFTARLQRVREQLQYTVTNGAWLLQRGTWQHAGRLKRNWPRGPLPALLRRLGYRGRLLDCEDVTKTVELVGIRAKPTVQNDLCRRDTSPK